MHKSLEISNFVKKSTNFSMKKATNSKNSGKISKLFPIMQEHFGKSMNLARIKLMTLLLEALVKAQTVNLVRQANAMPTAVDKETNMRRLQRFLACYVLDLDLIARMIFSLLPVKQGLVLTMDRTNRKYGKTDINVLLLGVTYKNVAFPLLSRLLPKRGNSNTAERIEIIERFNLEDTHLTHLERIERLLAVVCIAVVWSYLVGDHRDQCVKPIRILKNGRRAMSVVRYGLMEIESVL